jgi:hypothetical protein
VRKFAQQVAAYLVGRALLLLAVVVTLNLLGPSTGPLTSPRDTYLQLRSTFDELNRVMASVRMP